MAPVRRRQFGGGRSGGGVATNREGVGVRRTSAGWWVVAAVTGAMGVAPTWASAQIRAMGVVAGPVDARQLRTRGEDSGTHSGFLAGAWLDVGTPKGWLSVTAEAVAARRGAVYPLGDGRGDGQIDADYLTVNVLPTVRLPLGPVSALAYAGPSLDAGLRTRAAPELQGTFRESTPQVLAVTAGGGAEVLLGRATIRLEARVHEQLTDAFSQDAGGVRHRSREIVLRVGMRPRS